MKDNKPIIVFGAGSAGIACALSASRHHEQVYLIEKHNKIGGIITKGLINTLGGFFDYNAKYLNPGLPATFADHLLNTCPSTHKRKLAGLWNISISPEEYENSLKQLIKKQKNVNLFLNSTPIDFKFEKNIITQVRIKSLQGSFILKPLAIVDTTGNAEVLQQINKCFVHRPKKRAAAGIILVIRNTNQVGKFPKNIKLVHLLEQAARQNILPAECMYIGVARGFRDDQIYIKMSVDPNQENIQTTQAQWKDNSSHSKAMQLLTFLHRLPDCKHAEIEQIGVPCCRDGYVIKGKYRLTKNDLLNQKSFTDCVCKGAWPIEFWDIKEGLQYMASPAEGYDIPLGCLIVKDLNNVLAAGKCISADRFAQSSIRVVGCCWATGTAAGKAAAGFISLN